MSFVNDNYKHSELTDMVICCFYNVYNALGYGFLEKVYQKALLLELSKKNIRANEQYPINVYYDRHVVGEYFADILVEDAIIIEIKAARNILSEHEAQLLNYLRATPIEIGLLLNFGQSPQIKRKIIENGNKPSFIEDQRKSGKSASR